MSGRDDTDLIRAGGEPKPEVVVEAERAVERYGLTLAGTGAAVTTAYWLQALIYGWPFFPMSWWALFLVGLVVLFFFPQTRTARKARDVLQQWDEIETRNALEISGAPSDPRVRVAETMANRVVRHPGVPDATAAVVTSLLAGVRQAARDQRVLELMRGDRQGGALASHDGVAGSLHHLAEDLEARIGRLLGALAEVHAAVVERDAAATAEVLASAGELLVELEASLEIDRMLAAGDD